MRSVRRAGIAVLMLAGIVSGCVRPPAARLQDEPLSPATYAPPGRTLTPDPQEFQFAIISDRTGGHRPGVFEHALSRLNLLRPDFVMSVGDLIEGYSTDPAELDRQWRELIGFVHTLEMPFHFVPGNHDISNPLMADLWRRRFGPPYNHFVHRGVLFLCLDTQDQRSGLIEREQIDYAARTLAEHRDVRWTLVFFHQPLWIYDRPTNWEKIETLLQDRPYTVFTGHMHRYNHEKRHGRDYYILGTSGGASLLRGPNYGEFDEVAWVTMTRQGPCVANLMLDGIRDESVCTNDFEKHLKEQFGFTPDENHRLNTEGDSLSVPPLITNGGGFTRGTARVEIRNPSDYPLTVQAAFDEQSSLRVWPGAFRRELAPHAATTVTLEVSIPTSPDSETIRPLPLTSRFSCPLPGRPPLEFERRRALLVLDQADSVTQWRRFEKSDAFFGVESLAESGRGTEARAALEAMLPRVASPDEIVRAARLAGRIDPAWQPAPAMGFVTAWRISGPFVWRSQDGIPVLPEETRPEQVESKIAAADTRWRALVTTDTTGRVSLLPVFGALEETCAFARAEFTATEARDAVLRAGSDDGLRIWLNDRLVHQHHAFRGVSLDQDCVPVRLRKGINKLVVQVTQSREGWGFALRVTDEAGLPLSAVTTGNDADGAG